MLDAVDLMAVAQEFVKRYRSRERIFGKFLLQTYLLTAVMLSHRGQVGLEAKILSSSSSLCSKICTWPRPWP